MSFFSRLDKHTSLMNRMADRNGADLDLALQSGMVSPGELRAAVLSCTACTAPDACEARLDAGMPGVPGYCRNGDMIRSVARVLNGAD